jgi:hypothetical protein
LLTAGCLLNIMEVGWGWEVDGTGLGSCPLAGFGISGVHPSRYATRELVN